MQVFQAEKNLGLDRLILSNASFAYRSQVLSKGQLANADLIKADLTSVSTYDNTLYPMMDILVSSGENLNHDVFNSVKMWPARNTPKYKPLDLEHDQSQIIGSIIGTRIIGDDLQILDDGEEAGIPDSYHILNDSVIYRTWSDEDKLAATDKMIEEIEAGEWFVSMECQFDGFDYYVVASDGTSFTIPRTEETAFLTKYLAAYGGKGKYTDAASGEEFHIARELSNINFIGKGLVREPGNPNSFIFANASKKKVYSTEVELVTSNLQETITMAEDKDKDRIASLESTVASLTKELAERNDAAFASLKAEKVELEKAIAGFKTQISALEESVAKIGKAKADAEDEVAKKDEELAAKDEEIKAMKDDQAKCARIEAMVKAGADEEEAKSKADEFANLSEAQFSSVLAALSKAWAGKSASDTSTAAQKVIDNATPVKDNVINVPSVAKKEEASATLNAFVGSYLKTGRKAR